MLEEGPEIARCADRVGVLAHEPLGKEAPKAICWSTPNVHHPAHCAYWCVQVEGCSNRVNSGHTYFIVSPLYVMRKFQKIHVFPSFFSFNFFYNSLRTTMKILRITSTPCEPHDGGNLHVIGDRRLLPHMSAKQKLFLTCYEA